MLTKLEIDGFKNLHRFECRFGPYTCIAGINSIGKSNIFDAIAFLSRTASMPLDEAALADRTGGELAKIYDIFPYGDRPGQVITIAAEMLLPKRVYDEIGREFEATSTLLRYQLQVELRTVIGKFGRNVTVLGLKSEELRHVPKGEARDYLPWVPSPSNSPFIQSAVVNKRFTKTPFISTQADRSSVEVAQDQSSGKRTPIYLSEVSVQSTALSTLAGGQYPTLLAVKRELESWKMLSLEPSAMRMSNRERDSDRISENGGNLPAALYRLSSGGADREFIERLKLQVSNLIDLRAIEIDHNPEFDAITLLGKVGGDPLLPARSLSDGTLRFLSLSLMCLDDMETGLICLEEPENGIYPNKIEAIYDLMKSMAVDPRRNVSPENPLRQVIVNTHSPVYVAQHVTGYMLTGDGYIEAGELLFAKRRWIRVDDEPTPTLDLVPVVEPGTMTWRNDSPRRVTHAEVNEYLTHGAEAVGDALGGSDDD